jgi:hypothetical protein
LSGESWASRRNTSSRVDPPPAAIVESASRSHRGVRISAWHTEFTRMLSPARSLSIDFEKHSNAAFVVVAAGGVTWWRRRPARYWPA